MIKNKILWKAMVFEHMQKKILSFPKPKESIIWMKWAIFFNLFITTIIMY